MPWPWSAPASASPASDDLPHWIAPSAIRPRTPLSPTTDPRVVAQSGVPDSDTALGYHWPLAQSGVRDSDTALGYHWPSFRVVAQSGAWDSDTALGYHFCWGVVGQGSSTR
jgi:hypothetical protein